VEVRLDREVAAGAVHATLNRLEGKGLLASSLGPGTEVRAGRPRRYYKLSSAGRRALSDARTAVNNLWRGYRWPLKGHS
jgi:DNA-binding PadR family transcriptional regulator